MIEKIGMDIFREAPVYGTSPHPSYLHICVFSDWPLMTEGARIYFMKFILHDWSDEDCIRIL